MSPACRGRGLWPGESGRLLPVSSMMLGMVTVGIVECKGRGLCPGKSCHASHRSEACLLSNGWRDLNM